MRIYIRLLLISLALLIPFPAYGIGRIARGPSDDARLAVTVDDCWSIGNMRKILAIADKYDAKITFFPCGQAIRSTQDVWQDVLDAGHEIGNHSWSHPKLNKLSYDDIVSQIKRTQDALNEALGHDYPMKYLRPPYGEGGYQNNISKPMFSAVDQQKYTDIVMWSIDTRSAQTAAAQAENGSIILAHAADPDITFLTQLLPLLKRKGFEMVTISTLIGDTGGEVAAPGRGLPRATPTPRPIPNLACLTPVPYGPMLPVNAPES